MFAQTKDSAALISDNENLGIIPGEWLCGKDFEKAKKEGDRWDNLVDRSPWHRNSGLLDAFSVWLAESGSPPSIRRPALSGSGVPRFRSSKVPRFLRFRSSKHLLLNVRSAQRLHLGHGSDWDAAAAPQHRRRNSIGRNTLVVAKRLCLYSSVAWVCVFVVVARPPTQQPPLVPNFHSVGRGFPCTLLQLWARMHTCVCVDHSGHCRRHPSDALLRTPRINFAGARLHIEPSSISSFGQMHRFGD